METTATIVGAIETACDVYKTRIRRWTCVQQRPYGDKTTFSQGRCTTFLIVSVSPAFSNAYRTVKFF